MHSQEDRALRQLWGIEPPTVRGPKARWTLVQVAEAAVAFADEAGLEALSLSRVAERLDVTTTALYRYVDSKATLVDVMVDAAIGDPPVLGKDSWQDDCRAWVDALSATYAEHPWLADVRPTSMPCQPRAYAWIDALVAAVAGRAAVDPLRLALLLDSLVRTYAALERGLTGEVREWLGGAVAARFPRLAEVPDQDVSDARDELRFAVDAVLRGLS